MITRPKIDWIKKILSHRLGCELELFFENSCLKLKLKNSNKLIIFDKINYSFYEFGSNFSCGLWDPYKEGFISKLKIPIPTPGLEKFHKIIEKKKDNYFIHYDILGFIFWMLNRLEEINSDKLDNHNRFPAKFSHAYLNNYLDRPIVDEWIDIIKQIILRVWPNLKLNKYQFKIRISHDVDRPFKYLFCKKKDIYRQLLGDIFKRRNIKTFLNRYQISKKVRKGNINKDPFYVFDWMMDVLEKNDHVGTFYFLSNKTSSKYDSDYNLENLHIQNLLIKINSRGHKIGLHPSYNSYNNFKNLNYELKKLIDVCKKKNIYQDFWGSRMHFLRFQYPKTLNYLNDIGISYDESLTYADYSGFRCGTCFEYTAFNPIDNRELNISIKPLIIMECSISSYMKLGYGKNFLLYAKKLKERCKLVDGTFSILWHNSELQNTAQIDSFIELIKKG